MKFKVDENLPIDVAALLNKQGYDALTVIEEDLAGSSDSVISKICQSEGRILCTLDIGFADIRRYPPEEFPGLIVFRLRRHDKTHILDLMHKILGTLSKESIEGKLWIVEEKHIRVRT